MEIILFVLSATGSLFYLVKVISIIAGNQMEVPAPILHLFGWSFANAYISTPSIMYQVYFWSMYANLFQA
jgi:hypothetical protein